MTQRIFISAGELSGDIHAGRLVAELLAQDKSLKIFANGGDNMKEAGAELLYHINSISFMGFAEVIRHLPTIKKLFEETLKLILEKKVELVVLVDYPGFNLRLAKALHKHNIKVVYYIVPQIWAWHQSRVKLMEKYVDKAICILPFEPEWFLKHGVDAVYTGNPLMDKNPVTENQKINGLREGAPFIGLFPGSRRQELENHFDIMIESALKIRGKYEDMKFVVAMAPGLDFSSYEQKYSYDWLLWKKGQNDAIMQQAEYLIMVSGTASLEAALMGSPMLIIYRTSQITYYLAKKLARVEFIGLANIIAQRKGIHELIQHEVTAGNIFKEIDNLLQNPSERQRFETFYADVRQKIGGPGASQKTAKLILELLEK
ncbi:MAG: lipid-A-disaccharide synthase [Candidatus Marinimicrobia bacterium]|nr:lipid-A-disaccharide synthase [Candidatus Neomarinimicrobiota bacterium]